MYFRRFEGFTFNQAIDLRANGLDIKTHGMIILTLLATRLPTNLPVVDNPKGLPLFRTTLYYSLSASEWLVLQSAGGRQAAMLVGVGDTRQFQ